MISNDLKIPAGFIDLPHDVAAAIAAYGIYAASGTPDLFVEVAYSLNPVVKAFDILSQQDKLRVVLHLTQQVADRWLDRSIQSAKPKKSQRGG